MVQPARAYGRRGGEVRQEGVDIAKQQQAESHLALLEHSVLVKRHRLVSEIFRRCEETGVIKTKAAAVAYSGTIPIQNMVLSPTSTSYLRAKVSLPSSPMRKTERPAGTVFTASPSLTFTGRLCSATSRCPLGSM